MKQSLVRPGTVAMLSLGHRGAVRVTVESVFTAAGYRTYDGSQTLRDARFNCRDSNGRVHIATARRLSPVPVTSRDGALLGYVGQGQPGQTINAGDVEITTTLHRLG